MEILVPLRASSSLLVTSLLTASSLETSYSYIIELTSSAKLGLNSSAYSSGNSLSTAL